MNICGNCPACGGPIEIRLKGKVVRHCAPACPLMDDGSTGPD